MINQDIKTSSYVNDATANFTAHSSSARPMKSLVIHKLFLVIIVSILERVMSITTVSERYRPILAVYFLCQIFMFMPRFTRHSQAVTEQ